MPKYYIPEFYIKNFLISLLGLVAIAMIVSFIFDYSHNLYLNYSVSICIAIIATIIIGYSNAASSKKEKEGQPLFLHLFLTISLFIVNSIWGDISIFICFLRECLSLLFLQLGVYLYARAKGLRTE